MEKLLEVKNLRVSFHSYAGEVQSVRGVSFDVEAGQAVAVVGESGCGKSTLGRTILQLYDQTAGSTLYYGRTIDDFAPLYVAKTIKNANKLIKKQKAMQAKAEAFAAEVEAAGEGATFFQHQNKNLATAEAETAFQNIVKILGGFYAVDVGIRRAEYRRREI